MVIHSLKKFVSELYTSYKLLIWKKVLRSDSVSSIYVYPEFKLSLFNYGDITGMLYSRQHLVRWEKSFEYKTLSKFLSLIKEGDTIIDIGANIGLFSILAAKKLKNKCKIFSFEPSEDTFVALKNNLKINKCNDVVFPEQLALSDKDGYVQIGLESPKKNYKYGDAFNHMLFDKEEAGAIKMVKLDDYVEEHNLKNIDLIKIDIEGAELLCLKGAQKLLETYRPIIIFETNELFCKRFGYNVIDLLVYLYELNYSLEQIETTQWIAIPLNT